VRFARLRKPIIKCFPSYVNFRSRGKTAKGLDFGHIIRREHTREV
jgi:hypothetical protein